MEQKMVYSLDFRKKLFEVKKVQGLTYEQTAALFNIGKTTIVRWAKNITLKTTRNKPSTKINMDALKKDIQDFPDGYMYERAQRLGCSSTGILYALRRLNISYKKNFSAPKGNPRKKSYFL